MMRKVREANKSLDFERYKRELDKFQQEVPQTLSSQIQKFNIIKNKANDLEEKARR